MKAGYLTPLILLFALITKAQDSLDIKYPKPYTAVYKTVHALPEVKDFLAGPKADKPIAYISGPNELYHNYWVVQVGISNFDMLRTNFYLYVDPKTLKVYYLDRYVNSEGLNLKLITLKQWRKWRTTKAWQNHRYVNGKMVADTRK